MAEPSMIHACKHGHFDESTLSTYCSKIKGQCYGLRNCLHPELRNPEAAHD